MRDPSPAGHRLAQDAWRTLLSLGLAPSIGMPRRIAAGASPRLRRRVRLGAAVVLGGSLIAGSIALAPPSHGVVAVVFPPWVEHEAAIARIERAGGVAGIAGDSDGLLLAIGDGRRFQRALLGEGAVLILDGMTMRSLVENWNSVSPL